MKDISVKIGIRIRYLRNMREISLLELVNIETEPSNNTSLDKIILAMKSLSQKDAERVAHIVSEIVKINGNR